MDYIDTGGRDPSHAIGRWLEGALSSDVVAFRCQSGFFSAKGLGLFEETLTRLAKQEKISHILIGSNDAGTKTADIYVLAQLMGLPRANAKLGVVYFDGAYFHPKTYHVERKDGSQAAYVGSANLGLPGLTSLHIEAGVTFDSRKGDSTKILAEIASAVDAWFDAARPGLELVTSPEIAADLERSGISSAQPPPKSVVELVGGGGSKRPRLAPLLKILPFFNAAKAIQASTSAPLSATPSRNTSSAPVTSTIEPPYPGYVRFAPGRPDTTIGADALSEYELPQGVSGLVFRVSKDASRHFRNQGGTANVTLPISTTHTLRFGFLRRKTERPRAEFDLDLRLVVESFVLTAARHRTNVMVYGFSPGDTGHQDVRLVIPKAPAEELSERAKAAGASAPQAGDIAAIEWPTLASPVFKISFLSRGSKLAEAAKAILADEGNRVSRTAAWLPKGLIPD